MRQTASQTALGAALYRAAHQIVDRPRVFEDPLAVAIAGGLPEGDDRWTGAAGASLRAFLAVRSRACEDGFAASRLPVYVVLGAGLDTFGYRFPQARVVELDHPATQAWKRERLAAAGIAEPANVTYVAIDFEREALDDVLARAGVGAAYFAWLGVTPYLTHEATRATLATIGGGAAARSCSTSWCRRSARGAKASRRAPPPSASRSATSTRPPR